MKTDELLTTFNQLDKEELIALPGIGDVLADRVLAARPFENLEQVQGIKGIHTTLIQNLLDEEPVSSAEIEPATVQVTDAQPEAAVNDEMPKDESEADKPEQAQNPRADRSIEQKISAWENLSAYFLTALAAIILTLALLGGINGGLRFAIKAEQQTTSQAMEQLSNDVAALQKDVDGLRNRVDTLDGLTDRTMSIEQSQTELAEALDAATQELTAMQSDLESLSETVNQQDERTQLFEGFLESLQENLNTLLGTGGTE